MEEILKRYIAHVEGINAADIEEVSTYDYNYSGCDTCGHGGGYTLTIYYTHAGHYRSLDIDGNGISDVLNTLLEHNDGAV